MTAAANRPSSVSENRRNSVRLNDANCGSVVPSLFGKRIAIRPSPKTGTPANIDGYVRASLDDTSPDDAPARSFDDMGDY